MIDVQGTLIDDRDKSPIPGAVETIKRLHEAGVPYVLVTNNTKQESARFREELRKKGFVFDDEQYLDPLMVLDGKVPPCPVAAYGTPEFLEVLQKRGYRLDYGRPEAVLVAIKPDFTNDDYAGMIEAVLKGARLVGMHETSIYAKNGRRYPGVGAILRMVAFATGSGYEVVGKPSPAFYEEALARLRRQRPGLTFSEVTMVSDDLLGDLVGAKKMGMQTVLVLSGKIASVDEVREHLAEGADAVAKTAAAWFELREKGAA
ncbi:HAD-IIA family hydrolase [Hydrogenimonas sp. SS33]|uniref:HAD-IIA family hydrolase n=1 Tax=Hydrogenimonas leucolamina TaxID=2954236 RepID=UPI00336C0DDB